MKSTSLMSGNEEPYFDIVVVGAGPAGLMAATCLARWGYRILQVDNRPEPTAAGRADGIQPRTLHILRKMGLEDALLDYQPRTLKTMNFWMTSRDTLKRVASVPICPDSIDTRHAFMATLHQGLIERVFISDLEKNGVTVQRPWAFKSFHLDANPLSDYPVTVAIGKIDGTCVQNVHAKYLFGAEGAHSLLREHLGIHIQFKEPKVQTYGVLDGIVTTDFPDIESSSIIQSSFGSILVIPREKKKLVRFYVPAISAGDSSTNGETTISLDHVQQQARRILHPYFIEWDTIEWFSSYSVRQGVAERYSLNRRVFLGGDACHVHSPKTGQGMNLAFADALNLAWKIHAVESGLASPKLLDTYEMERKQAATSVIEFDHVYAAMFAESQVLSKQSGEYSGLAKVLRESRRLVSGYGTTYAENILNWTQEYPLLSPFYLPSGALKPGAPFFTADVTRVQDGKLAHLEEDTTLDGSFRVFIFAGEPKLSLPALEDLTTQLQLPGSIFARCLTPKCSDLSESRKGRPPLLTTCIIFAAERTDIHTKLTMPSGLGVAEHQIYTDDQIDLKLPGCKAPAHSKLGLGDNATALVIVRPDGYVGLIVRLIKGTETGRAALDYFSRLLSI